MGIDIGKMLGEAVKGVSDFFDNAGKEIVKAIDQNGDGILDESDIQAFNSKKQAEREKWQAEQAERQRKADLERLKPLFPENFDAPEFVLPKMIRIAEIDKEHAENPVCQGCVGYKTVQDDMTMITIFPQYVDQLGLTFYPEPDNNVYFADPCDRDRYILFDQYFGFMKSQRIAELTKIAQELGARYFKITYKERAKSITSNGVDVNVNGKVKDIKADAKVDIDVNNSEMIAVNLEAENWFPGHAPERPKLQYLKNDPNVVNLVEMRMYSSSPLQHQRFNIELSISSGIKVRDAFKIDLMLKFLKITGNTTVVAEAQNEARRILEYEVDF